MTASTIAQCCMVATLLLMITGKTPIYMTAIIGATISAIVAGIPFVGQGTTIASLINSGLNPVIADMTGVLIFIGIMQSTGFFDVIIRDVIRVGNKLGGGVGVCSAGGIACGVIGALTGFTQPVITAVITGPAAVRLGVDPNKVAGIQAHPATLVTWPVSLTRLRSPFWPRLVSVSVSSTSWASLPPVPFSP